MSILIVFFLFISGAQPNSHNNNSIDDEKLLNYVC